VKQRGIRVRFEWLDGDGGGICEIRGERWLFVDLAVAPQEQLQQSLATLANLLGEKQLFALLNPPVPSMEKPEQQSEQKK